MIKIIYCTIAASGKQYTIHLEKEDKCSNRCINGYGGEERLIRYMEEHCNVPENHDRNIPIIDFSTATSIAPILNNEVKECVFEITSIPDCLKTTKSVSIDEYIRLMKENNATIKYIML
jgi:hypothetical protein